MTTKAVTTADVILSAIRTEFQNRVELRGAEYEKHTAIQQKRGPQQWKLVEYFWLSKRETIVRVQ